MRMPVMVPAVMVLSAASYDDDGVTGGGDVLGWHEGPAGLPGGALVVMVSR